MPPEKKSSRKLAAILFADIVGYTALMQQGESHAMSILNSFNKITDTRVKEHHGEVIKTYGDGSLILFDSTVDAVNCAHDMQVDFRKGIHVPLRIGIHVGEVVRKDNDVFGNGVNIASRVESMGVAGAVLMSADVQKRIKNQESLQTQSLGSFEFKNIEQPIEVFALANEGFAIPMAAEMKGKLKEKPEEKIDKNPFLKWIIPLVILICAVGWFYGQRPSTSSSVTSGSNDKSVAILPFRDLSPDQNQEYFADGIVEAIRAKLAQINELKVTSMTSVLGYRGSEKSIGTIANELNVNHILEGTVFRDKNRVRIIAQLIETSTDNHLWAGTFDEELNDIFDIQSRIANEVTKGLRATLSPEEKIKLAVQVSSNVDAYDIYLSGVSEMNQYWEDRELVHVESAYQNFVEAISIDPELDKAYSSIGRIWLYKHRLGVESALDSTLHFANEAKKLNPYNEEAYILNGLVQWYRGDRDSCKINIEKALEISPNNTQALNTLANLYGEENNLEKQIELSLKALSLDPRNNSSQESQSSQEVMLDLAGIYDNADMDKEALDLRLKALKLYPNSPRTHTNLGWHYRTRGMHDKAIDHRLRFAELLGEENLTHDYLDGLGFEYFLAGKYEEAEYYYRKLQSRIDSGIVENPDLHIFRHRLAVILNETGRKDEARKMFDMHIQKCMDEHKVGVILRMNQVYDLAGIYAYLGEKEKAYEWLDKLEYRTYLHKFLRIDPLYNNLREEDRFKKKIAEGEEQVRRMRNKIESMKVEGKLLLNVES